MKIKIVFFCIIIVFVVSEKGFTADSTDEKFQKFLKTLKNRFAEYGWADLRPDEIPWEYHRTTRLKHPLMFSCFGDKTENCTLLLAAVHGDEVPTAYVLFKLAGYLKENPETYKDKCIIIAPLVNPDGFLATPPTRTNSQGVDSNRNFPTKDWGKDALNKWETREHKNKRYYPGKTSGSEKETMFQVALIKRFKPHKIVSLHSPLGLYDFDGPSTDIDNFEKWIDAISKETNHPLKKLGFFPGSLGNYAGLERNIFTLTLEFSSSEPDKGQEFYNKFQSALVKFLSLNISARYSFMTAQ